MGKFISAGLFESMKFMKYANMVEKTPTNENID